MNSRARERLQRATTGSWGNIVSWMVSVATDNVPVSHIKLQYVLFTTPATLYLIISNKKCCFAIPHAWLDTGLSTSPIVIVKFFRHGGVSQGLFWFFLDVATKSNINKISNVEWTKHKRAEKYICMCEFLETQRDWKLSNCCYTTLQTFLMASSSLCLFSLAVCSSLILSSSSSCSACCFCRNSRRFCRASWCGAGRPTFRSVIQVWIAEWA